MHFSGETHTIWVKHGLATTGAPLKEAVRKMTMEALEKVVQTEQSSQKQREESLAAAKQAVAEARKEGTRLVEEAQARGEDAARQMMKEAEQEAAKIAGEVLEQADVDCGALRQAAAKRLDQAAALIVERVVGD